VGIIAILMITAVGKLSTALKNAYFAGAGKVEGIATTIGSGGAGHGNGNGVDDGTGLGSGEVNATTIPDIRPNAQNRPQGNPQGPG
jgi:hypothetical protein